MATRAGSTKPEAAFISSIAHHAADPFRLLVDAVVDYAIFMVDPAGHVVSWNPGAERIYGYPAVDIVGEHVSRFSPPEDAANAGSELLKTVLQQGRVERECLRLRGDGSTFWAIVTTTNLNDYSGQHVGFAQVTRDITERRELMHALGERVKELTCLHGAARVLQEDRSTTADWLEALAALVPPAWQYPAETAVRLTVGDLEFASPGYVRTPWAQRAEFQCGENTPGAIEVVYLSEKPADFEGPFLREERHLIDSLAEMLRSAVERRLTKSALEASEAQFRQSQKMEVVGQLAAGVAHDFNNLLVIVSGYSEILIPTFETDDARKGMVAQIRQAADQAAGLTRQLLAFSRQTVLEPKVVDLNDLVRENEKMLRRLIGEDIRLTTVLEPVLDSVKVDPGLIGQVIINLALNARDAMPKGGTLTIETRNLRGKDAAGRAGSSPGRQVLLAVTDTGIGMTAETRARVFEPFFTTKEPGKGTGLGLATVYGIVKQSGGVVQVESEPDRGASFQCRFPVADEPLTVEASEPSITTGLPVGETILLVEDEEPVRSMIRLVLESAGYTVLEASRGSEALRVAEQHREPIHMVITDVVLPEIGGREVAEQLSERWPKIKVLYLSGYTNDAVVRHGVLRESVAFLQKPFKMEALIRKVRRTLNGETA